MTASAVQAQPAPRATPRQRVASDEAAEAGDAAVAEDGERVDDAEDARLDGADLRVREDERERRRVAPEERHGHDDDDREHEVEPAPHRQQHEADAPLRLTGGAATALRRTVSARPAAASTALDTSCASRWWLPRQAALAKPSSCAKNVAAASADQTHPLPRATSRPSTTIDSAHAAMREEDGERRRRRWSKTTAARCLCTASFAGIQQAVVPDGESRGWRRGATFCQCARGQFC